MIYEVQYTKYDIRSTLYEVRYTKYDIRSTKYAALHIFCIKVDLCLFFYYNGNLRMFYTFNALIYLISYGILEIFVFFQDS